MRKIIFVLIIIAMGFTSCKKDTNDSRNQTVTVSSLPLSITEYIENNYPDASIYEAVVTNDKNATYIVRLTTDEELAFNENAIFSGNTDAMQNEFTHDNHHAHHGAHGHHNGNSCFNHVISVDSLSSVISGYIAANYSGSVIHHVEIDTTCIYGAVTEISIVDSLKQHFKLYFDESGNYLMSSIRILYTNVPTAVTTTINGNYPNFTPRNVALKLTLSNNLIAYYIYLFDGIAHKRIFISDMGTINCEQ